MHNTDYVYHRLTPQNVERRGGHRRLENFKNGSRLDSANYRGIRLLSIVGKVFGRILNERVKAMTDCYSDG